MAETDRVSLWRQGEIGSMDLETLRQILTIQREEYEKWGRWPTPAEVRTILLGG